MSNEMQATQAIIPKARGMYAKRVKFAEYEEMMRRRTVPEVSALLRRHPFFEHSLGALTSDPHRGQLEELLNKDIFTKYEELIHYDFDKGGFALYYLEECEATEILHRVYRYFIGVEEDYTNRVPQHLTGKLSIDLFELAEAKTMPEALEVVRKGHSPYYKPMLELYQKDPDLKDFPLFEQGMISAYYSRLFQKIDDNFDGREKESVKRIFLRRVESRNLEMVMRVKTYFPEVYTVEELQKLLIPYWYQLSKNQMGKLLKTNSAEAFIATYRKLTNKPLASSPADPAAFILETERDLFLQARRVLRMSPSPFAALAAFMLLVRMQRDDIVTLIEGVRYKMQPEDIREMLRK